MKIYVYTPSGHIIYIYYNIEFIISLCSPPRNYARKYYLKIFAPGVPHFVKNFEEVNVLYRLFCFFWTKPQKYAFELQSSKFS